MTPHDLPVGRGGALHVADALSEPVLSVLGPALATLHEAGMAQTLVLLDRPEHASRFAQLHDAVRVVRVPASGRLWPPWRPLREALRECLQAQQPHTVHFHGSVAWLSGMGLDYASRNVFVTPHGGRLAHLTATLLRVQRWTPTAPIPVASSFFDALALQHDGLDSPLVEGVVADEYLWAPRRTASQAVVVSGTHHDDPTAVDIACRAAVAFGAAELQLKFRWCGAVGPESASRLQAAGVDVCADDPLPRLQRAWVYLAGGSETQFPVRLAQAMACGVPCLAADGPVHRSLIEDGHTGLLFRSAEEAALMLGALIDDEALRQRLGDAARTVARQRFSAQRLRSDLASLYSRSAPEAGGPSSRIEPAAET
ncbi:MAG TPA: glycosyltransferase [Burkholderiaceae bacterium]|jgi:glycosyltransferase involved in cell wall biosynthesis|nr:glycosyltransferase [Burkholderiaceae bacterium]